MASLRHPLADRVPLRRFVPGRDIFTQFWKKITLVGASLVFAFIMNLGRSLFLTGAGDAFGPDAINGTVHDIAGYRVLVLTCVRLLALVPLLNLKLESLATGAN
ncbi:MAG: hypothetical protein EXS42_01950 [Lacunisphaera sp.]|nr:hypothetical protein [Lacunisphaera sp.]